MGQRPGYRVGKRQSPEGAAHLVTPLQGFVREGQFSQGVAPLPFSLARPLRPRSRSRPRTHRVHLCSKRGGRERGRGRGRFTESWTLTKRQWGVALGWRVCGPLALLGTRKSEVGTPRSFTSA